MGIETEMPKGAFFVGERRVDCGVVEEQHTLIRIAPVMLLNRVVERMSNS